jgi:ATP phosphoribosyltransferase
MRIATLIQKQYWVFLFRKEFAVDIHQISGSVEIAPNIGLADAIVDIVSSGNLVLE